MTNLQDCVLRDLASGEGFGMIKELAKELLERRQKEKIEDSAKQPKSLKAPVDDDGVATFAAYYMGCALKTAACLRELLEYRRLTRRTHYQEGDCARYQGDVPYVCDDSVGTPVNPLHPCLIPLSNFAHLHHD
jgi:hypothetical protein